MENCDRLSELPDSIIFEIFWYLPFREVVRSSILSKRWQNIWSRCPNLNFEHLRFELGKDGVRDIVNRGLMMWRGTRIQKFAIVMLNVCDESNLYSDIDLWLRYAKEYQVQELYLHMTYSDGGKLEQYWAPHCLYSSSSLESLSLICCNLQIPTLLTWNKLEYLSIKDCRLRELLIDRLLSACPQLRELTLHLVQTRDNLCIRSTSLKRLYIQRYMRRDRSRSIEAEARLTIWTPALELLHVSGAPYVNCSIHAPSLTCAHLLLEYTNDSHLLVRAMDQIFPAIHNTRELGLSYSCIEAFGFMILGNMVSPFPNVSLLYLLYQYLVIGRKEMLSLIEIFPKLKLLQLEDEYSGKMNELVVKEEDGDEAQPNTIHLDSLLQELRTILKPRV